MLPLTETFCLIDDFVKTFQPSQEKKLLPNLRRKRKKACKMCLSEIMTIVVMFHLSHYRTFKDFYLNCLKEQYAKEFPTLVSYNRFIELMPQAFMPLVVLLNCLKGAETDKYYVDSTKLPVCHNLRIFRHQVFKDIAARGKTSTGWFFGLKLHLIFNEQGELMQFCLTPGNVDDRAPVAALTKNLKGWLFGGRGYISKKLFTKLMQQGLELITKVKKNMQTKVIEPLKEQFLNKRGMIETIIDQLKNSLHIDHTRHRSVMNAQVNVLSGLLAYVFKPNKVAVKFHLLNQATVKVQHALISN